MSVRFDEEASKYYSNKYNNTNDDIIDCTPNLLKNIALKCFAFIYGIAFIIAWGGWAITSAKSANEIQRLQNKLRLFENHTILTSNNIQEMFNMGEVILKYNDTANATLDLSGFFPV